MCLAPQRRAIFRHLNFKKGPNLLCFVHFALQMCFSLQQRANFARQNFQKWSEHAVFCTFWLANVLLATAAWNFSTSKLPKSGPSMLCFVHCDLKMCFSLQRRAIIDIATSKSGPSMLCFVQFDLQMCFSLQRREIFRHRNFQKWSEHAVFCALWLENALLATAACHYRHRNFQKWSEHAVFCTFWLANVLLATAACNFSTKQLQKVVRDRQFFSILSWKCVSRYSGVQFFISPLNSYLRTRRFTKPTFRPSRPTHHWKNIAFRDFPNTSRVCIFFLPIFAQLYLLSSDSTSVLCFLQDSATLLCFFNCPYCRKLDFKTLNFKKWSVTVSFLTFWLANVLLATAACNFSTSKLPKAVRACCVLYIVTCKCASRYSSVPFFHTWTSKSGRSMLCLVHFDLQICFSLQRRAIFPHLNFKKWSEHAVFCTFWLANVLLATAACHFSTSEFQKVVRACCVLCILTCKCASRYSGVHRFTKPTFRPSRPTNHWKNTVSRVCIFFLPIFAQLCLLSSDSTSVLCFFILWLCYSALLFQLSILSEVRLLNFLW